MCCIQYTGLLMTVTSVKMMKNKPKFYSCEKTACATEKLSSKVCLQNSTKILKLMQFR